MSARIACRMGSVVSVDPVATFSIMLVVYEGRVNSSPSGCTVMTACDVEVRVNSLLSQACPVMVNTDSGSKV